jgi:hypothetical protein
VKEFDELIVGDGDVRTNEVVNMRNWSASTYNGRKDIAWDLSEMG